MHCTLYLFNSAACPTLAQNISAAEDPFEERVGWICKGLKPRKRRKEVCLLLWVLGWLGASKAEGSGRQAHPLCGPLLLRRGTKHPKFRGQEEGIGTPWNERRVPCLLCCGDKLLVT